MARILTALAALRRQPLCLDSAPDLAQICRDQKHAFRARLFTPLVTLQLFFLQILHCNTAITHLRQLAGFQFSASSYSDARARLPLVVFEKLLEQMAAHFSSRVKRLPRLKLAERRLILVDATTFSMPDRPELLDSFGMPPGQWAGIGYPTGKIMALIDDATGLFTRMIPGSLFTHDLRGAIALHPDLQKGDILLGDTAFCSLAHFCMLVQLEVDGVFRLHQRRPKIAGIQRWRRAEKPPVWMSMKEHEALPEWMDVRVVKHIVKKKGYRTKIIFIATTLMNRKKWPDETIVEIYGRRWNIEVCFDHLKTTMNMSVLKCVSLEGIKKELLMYMIVYNRIRMEMLEAGDAQEVDAMRISFVDAMRRLAVRLVGLPGVAKLIVNPSRPGRCEPRVKRRRAKSYKLMTKPRDVLKKALFTA